MADPPSLDETLAQMMTDLDVAIENKSDNVLKVVETVLEQIKNKGIDSLTNLDVLPTVQLVLLLRWKNNHVVATVANILAEVAKSLEGRERLTNMQPPIAQQLINLLQQKSADMMAEADGTPEVNGSVAVVCQVCRALGNMCYEYERGQKSVLDAGGLPVLTTVIERAIQLADEPKKKVDRKSVLTLRTVASGFLLNMVSVADKPSCLNQLVPLLTRLLEQDGLSKEGEELTEHTLVVLGVLLDGVDYTMDERLCKVLVHILSATTLIDIIGTILDMFYSHAESDKAKLPLARAGLCKVLVQMLEDKKLSSNEDGEHMTKIAYDLIVLLLNGDDSMPLLYNKGHGALYQSMKQWLKSEDENRVVTAVLAMGNFARSDTHTLKMVEDNIGEIVLELIKQHNNPSTDEFRLQHSLLSALRNLAIPEANKTYFVDKGAIKAILPLLPSPALPLMFKLLGTLRTLIDGQKQAAKDLGTSVSVVRRVVECCSIEQHEGVKGEANRLLAWLIKSSRSEAVCRVMLDSGAVPYLVNMLGTEHAVMRNESILALTTICATNMQRAETHLVDAKLASKIVKMLNEHGLSTPKPIISNVITLLGELVTSELLCKKLACAGVNEALLKLLEQRQELEDLKHVVLKFTAILENS